MNNVSNDDSNVEYNFFNVPTYFSPSKQSEEVTNVENGNSKDPTNKELQEIASKFMHPDRKTRRSRKKIKKTKKTKKRSKKKSKKKTKNF